MATTAQCDAWHAGDAAAGECHQRRARGIRRMDQRDADDEAAIDHAGERERGDQRRHAEHGDAHAVEEADPQAGAHRHDGTEGRHHIAAGHQAGAQDAAEGRDRADGEVQPLAARSDDDRLTQSEQPQERGDLELIGDLAEADEARQHDLAHHQQSDRQPQQQHRTAEAQAFHAMAVRRCSSTMKPSAATITRPLKNSCQMLGMPAK